MQNSIKLAMYLLTFWRTDFLSIVTILLTRFFFQSEDDNVAVKVLSCPRAFDKLRPRQELELLQDLRHPNILRLVGAYEDEEIFIQVFEYLRQASFQSEWCNRLLM